MKKIVPIVLLVVVMIIAVGVVFAAPPGSGWKSGQQVQNVGGASAQIQMTAYDQVGNNFNCGTKNVAAGASFTFLTDVDCPVPAGFLGSAVVSADQPIAAIVNVNNRGTGLAAGQYQGTDGADVATEINFPLVKADHNGRTTTFYIQNASQSPNNITATFNVNGDVKAKAFNNVPANAMVVVGPVDAGITPGNGQVGSLKVVGTQPLAGSSLEHQTSAPVGDNLQASKAFTAAEGGARCFARWFVRTIPEAADNRTQVQNVSGGSIDITFKLDDGKTFTVTGVANGESVTFFMGTLAGIADGYVGSAVVEATGDVVAVTNDRGTQDGDTQVTTYACFSDGGTSVNLPLAKEHSGGNTTGIQVQNVGGAPTKVTLAFKSTNGKNLTIESKNNVAVGASVTAVNVFALPDATWAVVSGTPNDMINTVNGVVVSGSSDLAVIANESSNGTFAAASDQDTKNYEGFN